MNKSTLSFKIDDRQCLYQESLICNLFHLHAITPKCTYTVTTILVRQLFMLLKNRGFHLFREYEELKKWHYCTAGSSMFTVINLSCAVVLNVSG